MKIIPIMTLRPYPSPAAMAQALGTSRYPFRDHGSLAENDRKAVQS